MPPIARFRTLEAPRIGDGPRDTLHTQGAATERPIQSDFQVELAQGHEAYGKDYWTHLSGKAPNRLFHIQVNGVTDSGKGNLDGILDL